MLGLVGAYTNTIPQAEWDAIYYVEMAKFGIVGNPNLRAPFAYRPGMPFVSRVASELLSLPVESGFRVVTWGFALCFLMGVFLLSRHFTPDYRHALMTMSVFGLSAMHIKLPFFFYTLIDISAYALIVVAFWALITKRLVLCLVISSVGLLFKEWLAVPWFILSLYLAHTCWCSRSWRDFAFLVGTVTLGMLIILLPRLYIPVTRTDQFIDPFNAPITLKNLLFAWLDETRVFNIFYSIASYWLPTFLLLTPSRFHRAYADLKGFYLHIISAYLLLVLLLTMYGGTNILIFVSYSVAAQAVVLTLLFQYNVTTAEKIYVLVVMLLYNKIMLPIPTPQDNLELFADFYGGWAPRVALPTLMRFIQVGVYVILAACLRMVTAKIAAEDQQGASVDLN